jgi:hypothetical protein
MTTPGVEGAEERPGQDPYFWRGLFMRLACAADPLS